MISDNADSRGMEKWRKWNSFSSQLHITYYLLRKVSSDPILNDDTWCGLFFTADSEPTERDPLKIIMQSGL